MFEIGLLRKHRVAIYYIAVIVFLALLVSGAIALRGKLPAETYTTVGDLSDITEIKAYRVDGSLSELNINRTSGKLILDLEPEAKEIDFYMRQRVLDQGPNFWSLRILCTGSHSFTYRLAIDMASFEYTPNTEDADSRTFTYIGIGHWTLDSTSGTLSLGNLQVHGSQAVERGGNSNEDLIRIIRTDADGWRVEENVIKHVEFMDFAFVKEKEGRGTGNEPFSFDYKFVMLASYYLFMMFVLPLTFMKLEKSSSLLVLFITGFLLRISIAPFTSHVFDVLGWKRAARTFYEGGNIALFSNWSGPPLWYFTIITFYSPYALFRFLGLPDIRIYYQPILSVEVMFLKLPLILSDILSTFLIYKICRSRNLDIKCSKMAALVFLFNPFSILTSAIWCMYDSLAVFFALLGFYLCIKKRFYLSSLIWGLGVKWYTLGFIPFLSVLAYFQNRKERFSLRLMKSVVITCIGFGFFAFQMALPYLLYGDLSLLKQIMEFRLKIGGGGGEVESLFNFGSPGSFWKILQDVAGIRPFPNFFVLTFSSIYLVLIVGFYFLLKRSVSKENDTLKVFNSALISVLFLYFLTYPQLNPQTFLWIIPFLILAYYLFKQSGLLPIILVSIMGAIVFADIPYFIVGFGVGNITIPGWLIDSMYFVLSASIVPMALYSIISQLSLTVHSKIGAICQNLLSRLHQVHPSVLYTSTTLFMFLQALMFYYFNVQPSIVLSLLILSVIIQSIAFYAMRSKTWKENDTKHR